MTSQYIFKASESDIEYSDSKHELLLYRMVLASYWTIEANVGHSVVGTR